MKYILTLITVFFLSSCAINPLPSNNREVQYIESNSAYLPVVMTGPETKKIIIFVHGGPGLSGMVYFYMPFLRKLAERYKMVFWDQRGAGGSRGHVSENSINIPQFVEDMDVVYRFVKNKYPNSEIYILGHSYGGMVGGAYLTKHWKKIKGAMFVSPAFNVKSVAYTISPLMLSFINETLQGELTRKDRQDWEKAKRFYTDNPRILATQFTEHAAWAGKRDEYLGLPEENEYQNNIIPTILQDNIVENLDFVQERDRILRALDKNGEADRELSTDPVFNLGKVTIPVFVAVGKLDLIVPTKTSITGYNSLNNGTPATDSQLYEMEHTTHYGFVQPKRDQLFDEIITFMNKI